MPNFINGDDLKKLPYHIELRRDDQFQSIIGEWDIATLSDEAAVKMMHAMKAHYIEAAQPEDNIIALCISNWNGTCYYQDASKNDN